MLSASVWSEYKVEKVFLFRLKTSTNKRKLFARNAKNKFWRRIEKPENVRPTVLAICLPHIVLEIDLVMFLDF